MARPAPAYTAPTPASPASTTRATIEIQTDAPKGALVLDPIDTSTAAATTTPAVALDAATTQQLLSRLEPLPDLTAVNASAPTLRAPTAAPPRAGSTQPISFVVASGKPVADAPISSAATVTRPLAPPTISPTGDTYADAEIQIEFAEPMVPVAKVGEAPIPVATIEPPIAGTWRWIDTRVASFTATAARVPAATEFKVTVAAGVRAVSGAMLPAPTSETFSTPPVTISGTYPTTIRSDGAIAVRFDQRVDPARVLPFLQITTPAGRTIGFRQIELAAAIARWQQDPTIAFDPADAEQRLGAHYVLLAPVTTWPAGAAAQVQLAVGAPSDEGPRLTTRASFARFEVVPAFTVRGFSCGWSDKPRLTGTRCPANGYGVVSFSNRIATASFRASMVQLDGQPFEDHHPSGDDVSIMTPEVAGRTYTIVVGGGLVDVHGQPLVGPLRTSFTTTPEVWSPHVYAPTGLFVIDPRFEIPQWVIESQAIGGLRVQLYQVTPADYFAYEAFERDPRRKPPGKRVLDKRYPVGRAYGATLRVDLRPALSSAGVGHVVAVVSAQGPGKLDREDRKQVAWIQVTRLGIAARADREQVSAWAQRIAPDRFLEPVGDATATLLVDGRPDATTTTRTDAGGHAGFALSAPVARKRGVEAPSALMMVEAGGDSTFTALATAERSIRSQRARWYVTDDRFTYKPGEPVYVKGWVRWTHNGVNPGLTLPAPGETVAYTLSDARGTKLASGTAPLSADGGFDATITLPATPNLGLATFAFTTRGETMAHPISIEEFRPPAFTVALDDDVRHKGATPLLLGERIEMTAEAKYYAGGGLAGARVEWHADLRTTRFRPPNWNQYGFSPVRSRSDLDSWNDGGGDDGETRAEHRGLLTGSSTSSVSLGIAALPLGLPAVLSAEVYVTDVDRMRIRTVSRSIVVHPAAVYVGVRQRPGTTDLLDVIVTDIDGEPVAGVPIDVDLEGVLGSERFRDDAKVLDRHHCKLTSAPTPVPCTFKRRDLKTAYLAVARVTDARGRTNTTQYQVPWWQTQDARADLKVSADRTSYRPGDVAKIAIESTLLPSTAIVTFARQGVIAQHRVALTQPSTIVELPIEDAYLQNVHVVIDRIARNPKPRSKDPRPLPEHTSVELELPVEVESARLVMKAQARTQVVEPGASATFDVEVTRDGKPVADAEVALMVVDEAVLALSWRSHRDPLPGFYAKVDDGTSRLSSISLVRDAGEALDGGPGFSRHRLDDGSVGSATGEGRGGMRGRSSAVPRVMMGSASSTTVSARQDFRANALFAPRLRTDARGIATATVKMPDSLTRFRIVALAAAHTRYFGKAEGMIVTQRKLNARTTAPRFLTQGDRFSLPVVVQNLDLDARTIDVAVRAGNLAAVGPMGKRITVPGGQRAEVRFEFATQGRGKAVIQTILRAGTSTDASNVELPIYAPATTESFATYGTIDAAPQLERLAVPAAIFPDVGGVEVELASTQLQNLTDAYWYLYAYPYECAEQRSGRMLATAAMFDLLDAFATPGRPTRAEVEHQRTIDAKALAKTQRPDGGWGYFRSMASDPFVTMQVLSALVAQQVKGEVTARATSFVTQQATWLLARLAKTVATPAAKQTDRLEHPYVVSLAATALATLATTGVDVTARAQRLDAMATTLGAYPIDAKARVLALVAGKPRAAAIRARLLAELVSATHSTAAVATVTVKFVEAERLLLVSNTRTTALALDAIMREAPSHALIPKLARGLLEARARGRWRTTQENVVVLQTMRRYFDTYEKATPNFVGKLWFGKAGYAEQAFVGRSTARGDARLGWDALPAGSTHDLTLAKDGPGRMYYRIGITYAPKQLDLPALDAGFIVRRAYTAIDDPKDVTRLADGRVRVRLGARVLVTIETLNTTRRHQVAVVDPMPAGFEAVNAALATSERPSDLGEDTGWDFRNLRDSRSEAFAIDLAAGSHRLSYTVRANTPGTFVAAPAKAEEMYSPETFGRSTGAVVVIE